MSFLIYAGSVFICALLFAKVEGITPPKEAFLILAILSAAEAIGLRINK